MRIDSYEDDELKARVCKTLGDAGFAAELDGAFVHVTGAGVGTGDASVDFTAELLLIDGVPVVRLDSQMSKALAVYERAQLAAIQGNALTVLSKFRIVEDLATNARERFSVHAQFTLFAGYLSDEELVRMTTLFVGEVDEVDNGIREVLVPRN